MKTLNKINMIAGAIAALFAMACLAGCTAAEFQSTVQEPNSPFQVAADSTGTILQAVKPLSPIIAGIPYGQFILAGLAVLSAVVNGIQSIKNKKQAAAISQTVKAVEAFKVKADSQAVKELKTALADAQSPETKIIVYQTRQAA